MIIFLTSSCISSRFCTVDLYIIIIHIHKAQLYFLYFNCYDLLPFPYLLLSRYIYWMPKKCQNHFFLPSKLSWEFFVFFVIFFSHLFFMFLLFYCFWWMLNENCSYLFLHFLFCCSSFPLFSNFSHSVSFFFLLSIVKK